MSAHWVDEKDPPTSRFIEADGERVYEYMTISLDDQTVELNGTLGVKRVNVSTGGLVALLYPGEARELARRLERFAEIAS